MSVPVWCVDLAEQFWLAAGSPPPFPRDLRRAATAVPLTVVDIDGLTLAGVCRWFERCGLPFSTAEPDRPLRACLVARQGVGFAFVDRRDDPAERAFSLAHELAHFLRDYRHPWGKVETRLGKAALEVLDGRRGPTPGERLAALLRRTPLTAFAHLLRRDDDGRPATAAEREAEDAADRLAFELLAPADAVGPVADRATLVDILVTAFGLPPKPAARYAAILTPEPLPLDPAIRRLARRS